MICVAVDSSGNLVNEACSAGSLIVFTQEELAAQIEANSKNPFDLSPSDATSIAWMIILVWLTAWSIKQLVKVINLGDPEK